MYFQVREIQLDFNALSVSLSILNDASIELPFFTILKTCYQSSILARMSSLLLVHRKLLISIQNLAQVHRYDLGDLGLIINLVYFLFDSSSTSGLSAFSHGCFEWVTSSKWLQGRWVQHSNITASLNAGVLNKMACLYDVREIDYPAPPRHVLLIVSLSSD